MKKLALPGLILITLLIYVMYLSVGQQISYYSAHVACGNHFLSNRPISSILKEEARTKPFNIDWIDNLFYSLLRYSVNLDNQTISVDFGSVTTTMKYYPLFGCSTDLNKTFLVTQNKLSQQQPKTINEVVQSMIENEYSLDNGHRALVVMHKENIVGEKYDQYSSPNTPLLSWSMTKSISSLLFGRLEYEGLISLDDRVFPDSTDPYRKLITYRNLLNHTDGLDYVEAYYPFTDFFKMFISKNIGNYLTNVPFKHKPGEYWSYSSAATNLLTYKLSEIGNQLGYNIQEMFQYFLFDELEIFDAVIGKDPSGNMIASSLGFISPTAWLQIGKLMINNGSFRGKQLLNDEFVDFMLTPVILSDGTTISNYGGQWWLNTNDQEISPELYEVNYSIYSANGFQGQRLLVIPDLELLIVRMGLTDGRTEWNNEGAFIKDLINIYAN